LIFNILGVIAIYYLALKLSKNDWIGNTPRGPRHIPGIGCLINFLKICQIEDWFIDIFESFGEVVKYCLFSQKILLINDTKELMDGLSSSKITETTDSVIIYLLRSFGISIQLSPDSHLLEFVQLLWKYKIPMKDFAAIMESSEEYREGLQAKKVAYLYSQLIHDDIDFDEDDKKNVKLASSQMEKFSISFSKSPAKFLPFLCHLPTYFLERKRIQKMLKKCKTALKNIHEKYDRECDDETFALIFVLFFWMSLSQTSPPRKDTRRESVNFHTSSNMTDLKPYELSMDLRGVRFYKAYDYINIVGFSIPNGSILVSFSKKEDSKSDCLTKPNKFKEVKKSMPCLKEAVIEEEEEA